MSLDSYKCRKTLKVGTKTYHYFSLAQAEKNGLKGVSKLPYSMKVLLENLLRFEDGRCVFLDAHGCRIHAAQGPAAKPAICRQYPLVETDTGGGHRVGVDPGCYSAWQTRGAAPLAYLRFDETTGTIASDAMGGSHPGQLMGAATRDPHGAIGLPEDVQALGEALLGLAGHADLSAV